MIRSSKEAVLKFQDDFYECQRSLGQGRTSISVEKLRALVTSSPDVARDFVSFMCVYSRLQPKALQIAAIVASSISAELKDEAPMNEVNTVATQMGVTDILKRIETRTTEG